MLPSQPGIFRVYIGSKKHANPFALTVNQSMMLYANWCVVFVYCWLNRMSWLKLMWLVEPLLSDYLNKHIYSAKMKTGNISLRKCTSPKLLSQL